MKANNVNEIEYSPHPKIVPIVDDDDDDGDVVDHEYLVVNILSKVIIREVNIISMV
jgi:uncharacterized protein involved in tellurium resistance